MLHLIYQHLLLFNQNESQRLRVEPLGLTAIALIPVLGNGLPILWGLEVVSILWKLHLWWEEARSLTLITLLPFSTLLLVPLQTLSSALELGQELEALLRIALFNLWRSWLFSRCPKGGEDALIIVGRKALGAFFANVGRLWLSILFVHFLLLVLYLFGLGLFAALTSNNRKRAIACAIGIVDGLWNVLSAETRGIPLPTTLVILEDRQIDFPLDRIVAVLWLGVLLFTA